MPSNFSRRLRSSVRQVLHAAAFLALGSLPAFALDGAIGIHDPSTVIACNGHYYVYGTGRGVSVLTSNDGFTWQRGTRVFDQMPDSLKAAVPKNTGAGVWAPDVIKVNDRYYLYYAVSTWGSFVSAVGVMSSPSLDPADPKYKWTDGGVVVRSNGTEDLNAIDPGVTLAPDGTLWLCYGSYHGKIQLVQLDPKTGGRIAPDSPVSIISTQSEAADIICHDKFFYLFVNHGSCCQGRNSTYNIRVGRSAKITGPYLDLHGEDMARGGGTLFLAAAGKQIGPGHFGFLLDDGVEKFSCHYEADLDKGGRSVLAIQPLLWTIDGWPAAGENVRDGNYQLLSRQTGTVLEIPGTLPATRPAPASAPATAPAVSDGTPAQLGRYLVHEQQQWTLSSTGGGFYKIINLGSGKALSIADSGGKSSAVVAAFTGADEQLWKVDELTDGSYRIASKKGKIALTTNAEDQRINSIELKPFTGADAQRWMVRTP